MPIVLFEDRSVEHLNPVSLGRPAAAITCGGYRLVDLLSELGPVSESVQYVVRPHLHDLVAADFPQLRCIDPSLAPTANRPVVWLNARTAPLLGNIAALKKLLARGQAGFVQAGDAVAAALLPADARRPSAQLIPATVATYFNELSLPRLDDAELQLTLFEFPHDIVRYHQAGFAECLAHRLKTGNYRQMQDGLFVAEGVSLGEHAVVDSRSGPVVLDRDVQIGPFCLLAGPAYVGPRSRLIEHAAIKDGVCLGHTCKIGGEIEASIVEPYTNKQHHGFLGHSYLGSWVNLGAGTSNSDLKNTYGQVNMEYRGRKVPTGMQFVGCLMGDYAKTAINTSIFTGKTIGACSMVYGFVTTNVPSFVNYARSFGQVTEAPVEVLIATQARMFARRNVEQRKCDIQLLRDMFNLTHDERHQPGEPLAPEPLSL